MSNYVTLSGLMLGLILIATFTTLRRLPGRPLLWTGLALIALTAVFDNLIVGAGIVGYDDSLILGIRVPIAPIEDFAYALGATLLVPALWQWNWRLAPREVTGSFAATATDDAGTADAPPASSPGGEQATTEDDASSQETGDAR